MSKRDEGPRAPRVVFTHRKPRQGLGWRPLLSSPLPIWSLCSLPPHQLPLLLLLRVPALLFDGESLARDRHVRPGVVERRAHEGVAKAWRPLLGEVVEDAAGGILGILGGVGLAGCGICSLVLGGVLALVLKDPQPTVVMQQNQ